MWKFNEDVELTESNMERPNIFGLWSYFIRFSPLNCSKGPFQIPCIIFSIIAFLSMGLRVFWMFWKSGTSFLTYGWGESFAYAFFTIESMFLLIGVFQITRLDLIRKFELNVAALRAMRVNKVHEKLDSYKYLHIRFTIYVLFIGAGIIGSAIFLLINAKFIYGTKSQSIWFCIVNFVVSCLCFYVHRLYLPIHLVLNLTVQREIEIFNIELIESLNDPNIEKLRKFGKRHVKLQNFANSMTSKQNILINYASFAILMTILFGSYITTTLRHQTVVLYFIFNIIFTISSIIIYLILLNPLAHIQESLSNTSQILLSAPSLQSTSEQRMVTSEMYEICRMMINRSIFNRQTATVFYIFDVTRKNVERSLFVITMIGIVMVVTYQFTQFAEDVGEVMLAGSKNLTSQ